MKPGQQIHHRALQAVLPVLLMLAATHAMAQLAGREPPRELNRQCIYGDCLDGYGVLEIKNSFGTGHYRGNFKNGKYHGQGKLTEMVSINQRAYYDGNWEEGIRSGRGTHYNGVDKLYIGEWKDNKRHGQGSYFFGLRGWVENQYSADWLSRNTENYTGEFMTDFYHGQGTYRWPDGQKYVGGFFANEKHGPGTFYYPSGTIRPQMWEYGKLLD